MCFSSRISVWQLYIRRAKHSPSYRHRAQYWQRRSKPPSFFVASCLVAVVAFVKARSRPHSAAIGGQAWPEPSDRSFIQAPLCPRRRPAVIDSWQTTADGAGTPHARSGRPFLTAQQQQQPSNPFDNKYSVTRAIDPLMTPTSRCRTQRTWSRRRV